MPPKTDTDFSELYEASYDGIYRVCRGYCGDAEQAADLTQEVFIRAWKAWDRFEGRSKARTWLYRIAVNTCLMEKRKRRIPLQSLGPEASLTDDPAEENPRVAQLYHHISQLPETDRLTISLVLEQVPYPEIADTLGASENSLRVRIHRIKKRLAQSFQHETA